MNKIDIVKNNFNENEYDTDEIVDLLYTKNEIITDIKKTFASCFKTSNIDDFEIFWKYFDVDKYIEDNADEMDGFYFYVNEF